MENCSVRLLGTFSIDVGNAVHFPTQKAIELFAFLLLKHKPVARDTVATALWPNVSEEIAKKQLRTTLWRLRKVLEAVPGVRVETSVLTIFLDCPLQVDVAQFETLVESIDHSRPLDQAALMQEALGLYRGELLEGRFYDWCEDLRRHFSGLYARLLRQLAKSQRVTGNIGAAMSCALRLLQIDPTDEDAHRELMLLYHLSGNRSAALAQFGKLRAALSAELGVQPSKRSIELWQYVQSQGQRPFPTGAPKLRTKDRTDDLDRVPFVGRQDEARVLVGFMNQAAAGIGCLAVVSGEAGIGKSALVDSMAVEAELRGFEVLKGACPDLEDSPPYQVFIQALWPRMVVAQSGLSDEPLALKVLIEGLTQRGNAVVPRSREIVAPVTFSSAIMNETLIGLLAGRYATKPTLLILEDLHRVDKASSNLLVALLNRLRNLRLFVLATVREEEHSGRELISSLIASGGAIVKT